MSDMDDWADAMAEQADAEAAEAEKAELEQLDESAIGGDGESSGNEKLDAILDIPVTISMEVGISVEESVAADSPPSFPQPSSNMPAEATDKIFTILRSI